MSVTILLVEDERAIADTVLYALQKEGFEPVWCNNGNAGMEKFRQLVSAHGGSLTSLDNPEMHKPLFSKEVQAEKDGYISYMDTVSLGMAVVYLGGGHLQKGDVLDPTVGVKFHKKIGDLVHKGEPILEYFCSDKYKFENSKLYLEEAIQINSERPELTKLIY